MKQFAFPLSIKYALVEERDECVKILKSIGYKLQDCINRYGIVVNNVDGDIGICSDIHISLVYEHNRHHIDHFNPGLIRDIASVCTNDKWQTNEPKVNIVSFKNNRYIGITGDNSLNSSKVSSCIAFRRPTLAEICYHHGYEIKGRDIVKKNPKQNDMKKYRPYKTFPDDIIGKVVKDNCGNVTMAYHMPNHKELICTTIKQYNTLEAFNQLTFLDSTPVGEEYEELVELVHDEVYLVRQHKSEKWRPRHFCKRIDFAYYFYDAGLSSKTVASVSSVSCFNQVCERTDALMYGCAEPSEYIIKQS